MRSLFLFRTAFYLIASLFCLSFITVHSVHADATEDAKKAIEALYNGDDIHPIGDDSEKGVMRSIEDLDKSFKHYAKDYVCIMSNGTKQTTAQLRATMKLAFDSGCQSMRSTGEVISFTVKGDTATVEMRGNTKMEMKRHDGIIDTIDAQIHGRDFWVKIKGQWFIKRSRIITNTATLNGKPFM